MSLLRNAAVQTVLTLTSRVLGFARDLALNARFGGQSPYMDAFTTALMFPNLFRRLFAEGAFAQAFVPVYGRERIEHGEEAAAHAASEAMSFLLAVVAGFCIVAQIAMPYITPLLLSAYIDDPETLRIATLMTQLTMPYLACMTLASLLSGVLNTAGRFALSAGVPVLLNICTIAPLVLAPDKQTAALWVSIAVSVAGVLQAGLLWWGVRRQGVRLRFSVPRYTPVVKRLVALAIPGALAGGATQINSLVSQVLTGSDAGARGVLYNADRLYQLPLGLIGVAVGLALVPRLTRHYAAEEDGAARHSMDEAIGLSMAFTLPAAAAFFIMPYFIIDATVTRGAFTHEDAARTADVLRHFAWGVPAFVLAKVFTPPFFARQDTRRPMRFAMISVGVNIVLGATLFFLLPRFGVDGVIGLAIATSAAGWLNVIQLAAALARERTYQVSGAAWARLARVGLATLAMSGVIGACALNYAAISQALGAKEIAIAVVGVLGISVFGAAALAFRAVRLSEIRGALRREKGAPGAAAGLPGGLDG